MKSRLLAAMVILVALAGCGVEQAIRENGERYTKLGAVDAPLTGIYSTYSYRFMQRYQVSHKWVNTNGCSYRASELPNLFGGSRSNNYAVPDIFEADGRTLQASTMGLKPMDFDRWVRSVKWSSQEKGKEGQLVEIGLKPVCFESWWTSSHYLRVRLQKRTLAEFEVIFATEYPEGNWRSQALNGLNWRVQSVPLAQLRTRPLNGVGGPYQSWLVGLGDTGYAMAIEMGANQESLSHPQAHSAIEGFLIHLVNALKVERLTP